MTYDEVLVRLSPEAVILFKEMVEAHLLAGSGDRVFLCVAGGGTCLIFSGTSRPRLGARPRQSWDDIDAGALMDLASFGLLHTEYNSSGDPVYRISGQGQHFYSWLTARSGSPVLQVDEQVRRLVSDRFASAHVNAAHHLSEAFNLLWSQSTSDQSISELGDHLRKSLMDLTSDIVGDDGGRQEQPVVRLKKWLAGRADDLGAREVVVLERLIDLTEATMRLDHRLNHVRDEQDNGVAPPTWDELRRAAFTTAFLCSELSAMVG